MTVNPWGAIGVRPPGQWSTFGKLETLWVVSGGGNAGSGPYPGPVTTDVPEVAAEGAAPEGPGPAAGEGAQAPVASARATRGYMAYRIGRSSVPV